MSRSILLCEDFCCCLHVYYIVYRYFNTFHTYKLSVVYRDVGEVGGGYNSGGFPISYYITTQSLMYVFDFVCFIPSKYLTLM